MSLIFNILQNNSAKSYCIQQKKPRIVYKKQINPDFHLNQIVWIVDVGTYVVIINWHELNRLYKFHGNYYWLYHTETET